MARHRSLVSTKLDHTNNVLTTTTVDAIPKKFFIIKHGRPWFDGECCVLKAEVMSFLSTHSNSTEANEQLWEKRRWYKEITKGKREKFEEKL